MFLDLVWWSDLYFHHPIVDTKKVSIASQAEGFVFVRSLGADTIRQWPLDWLIQQVSNFILHVEPMKAWKTRNKMLNYEYKGSKCIPFLDRGRIQSRANFMMWDAFLLLLLGCITYLLERSRVSSTTIMDSDLCFPYPQNSDRIASVQTCPLSVENSQASQNSPEP